MDANASQLLEGVKEWVKQASHKIDPSHDFAHINRVLANAMSLFRKEFTEDTIETERLHNYIVVYLSALLHEVDDRKYADIESNSLTSECARIVLNGFECPEDIQNDIFFIISRVSFSKQLEGDEEIAPRLQKLLGIVRDADRLEALGAIGIARCFGFGAVRNQPIYDPEIEPCLEMTAEQYKNHQGTSLNHFQEKLYKLPEMMHTQSGKEVAEERVRFMKEFESRMLKEWHGLA